MDPLSSSLAFATIVQLVGLFRSERKTTQSDDYENFLAWLRTRRHEETAELLTTNLMVAEATRELLSQQHDELMERVGVLEMLITNVAERIEGFAPLAHAIGIESHLSDQACSILRQMNEMNASRFLMYESHETPTGKALQCVDGRRDKLQIAEPRFIEDDITLLAESGMLRIDCNNNGDPLLHITRMGAKVGENSSP